MQKEALLEFMEERLGLETALIDGDTPLFSSGMIDSESLVELIAHVEETAGVTFGPDDLTLEHLDSIHGILAFVAAQQGESTA